MRAVGPILQRLAGDSPLHPPGKARCLGGVALPQRLNRKPGALQCTGDRAGEVATARKSLPHWLDPVLPTAHRRIGRAPMFKEERLSARSQDPR